MLLDDQWIRSDTPGCERIVFLDSAGSSLVPKPVLRATIDHLRREAEVGGYVAASERADDLDGLRTSLAQLLNCSPHALALTDSATRSWMQFFSAVPLARGDRILVTEAEYAGNAIAMLQRARSCGAQVEVVTSDASGQLDLAALEAMMDDRVRLVSLVHAPTNGGLMNPVAEAAELAHRSGALVLLDACQSVGQMRVDVGELGVDALSAAGRKWLRGPRGTGLLYVRSGLIPELEPPAIDLRGASWVAPDRYDLRDDAARFELWEADVAARLGLKAAVDYLLGLGVEKVGEAVAERARYLRAALGAIAGVTLHDRGRDLCGIVSFTVDGLDPAHVRDELAAQGMVVTVSGRASTLLDMTARGLDSVVRASPHYFVSERQLDATASAVARLAPRPRKSNGARMRKILLLGAGSDTYRRYLLESIAREYEVVLAQPSATRWPDDLVSASHLLTPDDHERLIDLATREQVDGVLTWMESCVEAAARVTATLGLPGHPLAAARASRDKHLMRSVWAEAGVASATSRLVMDVGEAHGAAREIGFPVVVKPRALAGSVGVTLASDQGELERAFRVAAGAELDRYETVAKGVLVEEYLDGPEVSVESIVRAGTVHVVAVTQKETGLPPGFEELGHVVGASDCDEALLRLVAHAHAALGLRDGATHTEVRLTARGPRLVEIAARLAGDLIPKLVRHATGIDLGLAAAAVATGSAPRLRATRKRCARVAFVYPQRTGEVVSLSVPPAVDPPDEARWLVDLGARVALPPEGFIGRLGYVLSVAEAAGACAAQTGSLAGGMVAELADVPRMAA